MGITWNNLNFKGKMWVFFNTIPCAIFGRENIPIKDGMILVDERNIGDG